jgi:GntR family transcriptional regulator
MRERGIKSTLAIALCAAAAQQIDATCAVSRKRRVESGRAAADRIELAKRFGVAIYTVRAGIGALVHAGILTRKQGKGTFVARHERDRTRQVLTKIFDDEHRQIIPTRQKVTFFRKQLADERARSLLSLDQRRKSHVYHWEVLVEVDGRSASGA